MYDATRYFTITGVHLDRPPLTLEDRTPELAALHAELFPPVAPAPPFTRPPMNLADDELLQKGHSE